MSTGQRVIDEGIGPWVLSADKSSLVRRAHPSSGDWPRQSGSWSPTERIPVRPEKRHRVALVGESVARGFLLDPVVTLADLCRDAFQSAGLCDEIELVDLAANNLSPEGALKLCQAAIELESTVIVLYVGNNFLRSTSWLDPGTRSSASVNFEDSGYSGYLAARRQSLAALARRFRFKMEKLCSSAEVGVVVVVPATNLLDWCSPWLVPTWLPANRLDRWVATHKLLTALPDEDSSETVVDRRFELANRLAELDGGSTPRPLEIVGKNMVRRGREVEGLELLSESVSVGADPAHYDRRCPLEVAKELRLLSEAPAFRLVDVPARFQARFGSKAFGRDMFLDYCHHTPDALGRVADDITAEAFAAIGVRGWHGRSAQQTRVGVPSNELADGYLLSALHNQHWGQSAETVEHWIAEALRTDPTSVESLTIYFSMSLPTAHFWLSADLLGRRRRMHWFLKNFSHQPVLDAEFARRALRMLGADAEAPLRTVLDEVWQGLRVEDVDELNLLEPFWRERDGPLQPATVFTGERSPISRYSFVTSGEVPLDLEAVLTIGPGLPAGRFDVLLNGHKCYSGPATDEWQKHEVTLPVTLLTSGANELAYMWPAAARSRHSMSSAISALGLGPESLHLVRIARMRLIARG